MDSLNQTAIELVDRTKSNMYMTIRTVHTPDIICMDLVYFHWASLRA